MTPPMTGDPKRVRDAWSHLLVAVQGVDGLEELSALLQETSPSKVDAYLAGWMDAERTLTKVTCVCVLFAWLRGIAGLWDVWECNDPACLLCHPELLATDPPKNPNGFDPEGGA